MKNIPDIWTKTPEQEADELNAMTARNVANLATIPQEFATFLRREAYWRGHSGGDYEIENIMSGLVGEFKDAWQQYQGRTGASL
jgi:hypothetical protein